MIGLIMSQLAAMGEGCPGALSYLSNALRLCLNAGSVCILIPIVIQKYSVFIL